VYVFSGLSLRADGSYDCIDIRQRTAGFGWSPVSMTRVCCDVARLFGRLRLHVIWKSFGTNDPVLVSGRVFGLVV
jgi:hypothetical protein